ncbi:hypothetical protein [Streptomyces sp. WMMB303]|uniref:hypothetical protein n=1 Tax=Streptomyces sp. WMMB303 TaxID=3034154 RepID=UPI0023ED20E4|nr:hypothetical protein [Streptomyces sp. WMMB303]MDF4250451.1 hypothetical protein [Streptomyces sp. WMMB303]
MAPEELAQAAADAVRNLNHATHANGSSKSCEGLEYPGDAYAVLGALKELTQRLPQTCGQIGAFLETQHRDGHLTAGHGTTDEHLTALHAALINASAASAKLTNALSHAHSALGPIGHTST